MRYIDIGGYVTPKHCIYGPRPAEGIVFTNYEWCSITDHLVKEQREREMANVIKAKEDAKKLLFQQMTSEWSDTLANIKHQGSQSKEEKKQRERQYKIDQYRAILKDREERKKEMLTEVKKVILEQSDPAKTLTSAVFLSTIIEEREKQIEMKRNIKAKEAKKAQEMALKIKKDVEDFEREQLEEKLNQKAKNEILKRGLEKQLQELNMRRLEEKAEIEAEKEDRRQMDLEDERIRQCNILGLQYRKQNAQNYVQKSKAQLEHERNLRLEEEEENEINKIYQEYARIIKRKIRENEERLKNEEVSRRQKIADMILKKLEEGAAKETDFLLSAYKQKEAEAQKEEEERKEKERQNLNNILEGKRQAEERRARENKEKKEMRKWIMMQNYKRAEVNEEWRKEYLATKQKKMQELKAFLDHQLQEKKELKEQELREIEEERKREASEKEQLLDYIQDTMNFIKEYNLPQYPVLAAAWNIKEEYGLENKEKQEMIERRNQRMTQQNQSKKSEPVRYGCYCFKY